MLIKAEVKKMNGNIVLSIKEDKLEYIQSTVEECYNSLEKGIHHL